MKNILVTGGTGFIGRPLVEELIKQKHKVYLLTRKARKDIMKGVNIIKGDLTKKETLKIPKKINIVFHLAGLTNSKKEGEDAYKEFMNANFDGTVNLVESCPNIKKFIYVSSVDALGIVQNKLLNEDSPSLAKEPYDVSKYQTEKYLLDKHLKENFPVVILRPSMVYGGGELGNDMKVNVAIFNICKMIKGHRFPIIGDGKNLLPLVHVNNVVESLILAEKFGKKGEIYMISDERSYTLNELVDSIAEKQKIKFPGFRIPKSFMLCVALFFEILEKITGVEAPIKCSGVYYITQNRFFDISKAKKELGYNPINLKEGVELTLNWFKNKGYL